MLEHRAPLAQLAGMSVREAIDLPGLQVSSILDRGLLMLQGDPQSPAFQEPVLRCAGVPLAGPGACTTAGGRALVWSTPREWLLDLRAGETSQVRDALVAALAPASAAVTDLSNALAHFELSGSRACELLMAGCSVDLNTSLGVHRSVRTQVAGMAALLWRPIDALRYRCLVDRSHAGGFWNWLREGASLLPPDRSNV